MNHERLATCLRTILEEPEWKARMVPPSKKLTQAEADEYLVVAEQHANTGGLVGRFWGQLAEAIRNPDDDILEQVREEEERIRELTHYVASQWVTLIEIAKKRGMTGLDARNLPVPTHADLEQAWNEGAPQFGLTGQDFSDFVGEALSRMRTHGDYPVL